MRTSTRNALSAVLWFLCIGLVRAQASETILHNFTTSYAGSAYPVGPLVYANGLFYGVAQDGPVEIPQGGSIFTMTPSGTVTTLYKFSHATGAVPYSGLIAAPDGNFYGTVYGGGPGDWGAVYKITPAGVYTVLHQFTGQNTIIPANSDGGLPYAGLLLASDGKLYGVTSAGGSAGYGTVFCLNTDGSGYTILRAFQLTSSDYVTSPQSALAEGPDGRIYGVSIASKQIFGMNKDGSGYAIVHSFSTSDPAGYGPDSDLTRASDGKLYGACIQGGAYNLGTVFQLDTSTGAVNPVYAFNGDTGAYPGHTGNATSSYDETQYRLLQGADGALYGTTVFGGFYGFGTAFRVTTSGVCSALTSFGPTDANGTPNPLTEVKGILYLTSWTGGNTQQDPYNGYGYDGTGAAMSISVKGQLKMLHSFTVTAAYGGTGSLVQVGTGSTAAYYGVTNNGGEYNSGTIYKTDAAGNLSVVHALNAFLGEGTVPAAGLLLGRDGMLYGTTLEGGKFGFGTVFKCSPSGKYTVIHHFRIQDGFSPTFPLAQGAGADNTLYGTCSVGGVYPFDGTVFSISTTGANFKVLHHFNSLGPDGNMPECTPLPDGQGNLYGTTYQGGADNYGIVWKISTTGANYQHLVDFYIDRVAGTFPIGANPMGPMVFIGGKIYGATQRGGTYSNNNNGTLISIDPATGDTTALYSFGGVSTDGTIPMGGVVYDSGSGNLYGTCQVGGVNIYGTVFAYNLTSSVMTVLHAFSGVDYNNRALSDGAFPNSGVILGADGQLYGTTPAAGSQQYGLIYKQTTTP